MSQTALITGASSGIGKAIALELAGQYSKIAITSYHNPEALKNTQELLSDLGVECIACPGDCGDPSFVQQFVSDIISQWGQIDTLVNNAGIPGDMAVTSGETQMKDVKETTDVNYYGTLAITQALLPLIKANKGRIANITVPSEISPYWHPLAYVASKAAQNAMMGVMAMEFQQNNVPVEIFSVHPGPTTTDLNGNMSLPGFHDIETVGKSFAELINDGKSHNGEFIELYPIVKED